MAARKNIADLATLAMAVVAMILLVAQPAFSGQLVEYLPGYGKLDFKLETGYVNVGDSELFYYFFESQGDPETDPLFFWLSGGPGCSALNGIVYGIGPMKFNMTHYGGGPVTLNYFPGSWTKYASILFLDSPVGTGFSFSRTQDGWATSDTKASKQAYQFLLKWLEENTKYLSRFTYIAGDSYGGIIVPQVTKLIIQGIEANTQPHINLKGYVLGSPVTDDYLDIKARFIFAHRMGLISEEIYKTAKESCNDNYVDVDPSNTKCALAMEQYNMCVKDLDSSSCLDPKCSPRGPHEYLNRRSLQEFNCRNFLYQLPSYWMNDPLVREALHVRKDTVAVWYRCTSSLNYTTDVTSVISIHKYLTTKELNVLIMNGDRDISVPLIATEYWIKSLNLTVEEKWRPWFVDGQVAGYTEKYYTSENGYELVLATVKGAGHIVQYYNPSVCSHLFERWVHWYPL